MAADQGLIDSVANENTKVTASAPVHWQIAAQKATADAQIAQAGHFARLQMIAENALQQGIAISQAATGAIIKGLVELDAVEAMSNAVIGQQGAKVAQSTPPETAVPK
jgi:hypothetical protein